MRVGWGVKKGLVVGCSREVTDTGTVVLVLHTWRNLFVQCSRCAVQDGVGALKRVQCECRWGIAACN